MIFNIEKKDDMAKRNAIVTMYSTTGLFSKSRPPYAIYYKIETVMTTTGRICGQTLII